MPSCDPSAPASTPFTSDQDSLLKRLCEDFDQGENDTILKHTPTNGAARLSMLYEGIVGSSIPLKSKLVCAQQQLINANIKVNELQKTT